VYPVFFKYIEFFIYPIPPLECLTFTVPWDIGRSSHGTNHPKIPVPHEYYKKHLLIFIKII